MKRLLALFLMICMIALIPAHAEEINDAQVFFENLENHLAQLDTEHMLTFSVSPEVAGGESSPFSMFFQQDEALKELTANVSGQNFQAQLGADAIWVYAADQVIKVPFEEVQKAIQPYISQLQSQSFSMDLTFMQDILNDAMTTLVAPYLTVTEGEDGSRVIRYEATIQQLGESLVGFVDRTLANEEAMNTIAPFVQLAAAQNGYEGDPIADLEAQWAQAREAILNGEEEGGISFTMNAQPQPDGSVVIDEDILMEIAGESVHGVAKAQASETDMTMVIDEYVASMSEAIPALHMDLDVDTERGIFDFFFDVYGGNKLVANGTFGEDGVNVHVKASDRYSVDFDGVLNVAKPADGDGFNASLSCVQGYDIVSAFLSLSSGGMSFNYLSEDNIVDAVLRVSPDGVPTYAYFSAGDSWDSNYYMYKDGVFSYYDGYQLVKMYLTFESDSVMVLNVDTQSDYYDEIEHGEIRCELSDDENGWNLALTVNDPYGQTMALGTLTCEEAVGIVPLEGRETFIFTAEMVDMLVEMVQSMAGTEAVEAAEETPEAEEAPETEAVEEAAEAVEEAAEEVVETAEEVMETVAG